MYGRVRRAFLGQLVSYSGVVSFVRVPRGLNRSRGVRSRLCQVGKNAIFLVSYMLTVALLSGGYSSQMALLPDAAFPRRLRHLALFAGYATNVALCGHELHALQTAELNASPGELDLNPPA